MRIYFNSDIPVITLPFDNLNNKTLENFDGHRALFDNLSIKNLTIMNSDLRNTVFNRSIIKKSKFINSKLILTEFENSEITDTEFDNSNVYSVNFKNSNLKNVAFKNCNMREVDFSDAILFDVSLETSLGFETSIFSGTYYNSGTKFPENFNLKNKNLIFADNYVMEKYIELEKEYKSFDGINEKHPLRDLERLAVKYDDILSKKDLESFMYYLILFDLGAKYKVMYNFISDEIEKLAKKKEIFMEYNNFTAKEVKEIKILLWNYEKNMGNIKIYR
ncbi:pentapeptide repeat-containing protein [Sebaldella sp. S0638]|uniref:pentapeptide repeat-containing protein n=1 Tax=Sebaldella sp. S0638 TaxID=2957809 RepID=UPI00209CF153|nr:pentapeptide repeat-containing protein [Sebaldella sp. S0638]MCP1223990.1 pentapeptide repeat-containing protein [Sebaldella sp. S0638]